MLPLVALTTIQRAAVSALFPRFPTRKSGAQRSRLLRPLRPLSGATCLRSASISSGRNLTSRRHCGALMYHIYRRWLLAAPLWCINVPRWRVGGRRAPVGREIPTRPLEPPGALGRRSRTVGEHCGCAPTAGEHSARRSARVGRNNHKLPLRPCRRSPSPSVTPTCTQGRVAEGSLTPPLSRNRT